MAVSKNSKNSKSKPQVYKVPRSATKPPSQNPKWLVPTFSTLLIVGTLTIVVYYLSSTKYPLPIGQANLFVGFGLLLASLILLTRWK